MSRLIALGRRIPSPLFLVVLFAWPAFIGSARTMHLAVIWIIYAVGAFGLAVLYRATGLLSVAHAAMWGIGAYAAVLLAERADVGFWPAMVVGAAGAAAASLLIGLPSVRVASHYFLIITFAATELIVALARFYTDWTGGPLGVTTVRPVPSLFGVDFNEPRNFFYLATTILIVGVAVFWLISLTRVGRRALALRENEQLLRQLGVRTAPYKLVIFAFSGIYGAVSGVLFGYYQHHVDPNQFGAHASLVFALIVILGGASSVFGPVIGSWVWIFLPEFLHLDPLDNQIALGALLIAVMLLFPGGITGLPATLISVVRARRREHPQVVSEAGLSSAPLSSRDAVSEQTRAGR